jgi:hypothetical protein
VDHPADVELVERVIGLLPMAELRMALITGSVARGLEDASSDLDVYLYWERVDTSGVSDPERFTPIGADRAFGLATATGWFSKLRVDDRYIDVEDVAIDALSTAADALAGGEAPPGWAVKVAVGIRDALAVHGGDELVTWQRRLTYGDAAATAEVATRLPRLLAPSALYALTYARGDVLSFTARLSGVLLDLVAVLGAVNRRFIPVDDPKWLPWHLSRLTHIPVAFGEHVDAALTTPSPDAMAALDADIGETLDLVDRHVPGVDTRAARYAVRLRPRPGP